MTDNQRCRTCRFWTPREPRAYGATHPPEGWGICSLTIIEHDAYRMENTAPVHPQSDPDRETLAYAQDMENYVAELHTAPDFGCVQWEAKG